MPVLSKPNLFTSRSLYIITNGIWIPNIKNFGIWMASEYWNYANNKIDAISFWVMDKKRVRKCQVGILMFGIQMITALLLHYLLIFVFYYSTCQFHTKVDFINLIRKMAGGWHLFMKVLFPIYKQCKLHSIIRE